MKRYSIGYIYASVDFSGFVKNMETSDYRIRYIVYMQIPDAGHCLTLFGPISGFVCAEQGMVFFHNLES